MSSLLDIAKCIFTADIGLSGSKYPTAKNNKAQVKRGRKTGSTKGAATSKGKPGSKVRVPSKTISRGVEKRLNKPNATHARVQHSYTKSISKDSLDLYFPSLKITQTQREELVSNIIADIKEGKVDAWSYTPIGAKYDVREDGVSLAISAVHRKKVCFIGKFIFVAKTSAEDSIVKSYISRIRKVASKDTIDDIRLLRCESFDLDQINTALEGTMVRDIDRKIQSEMETMLSTLFKVCRDRSVTDIHILATPSGTEVRVREIGDMSTIMKWSTEQGEVAIRVLVDKASHKDANFTARKFSSFRLDDKNFLPEGIDNVRGQVNPVGWVGSYCVLRLQYVAGFEESAEKERLTGDPTQLANTELVKLGYAQEHVELISFMRRETIGLFIVSGPTGSGKSTTLVECIEGIQFECDRRKNIITAEDPPERPIKGAQQLPVNSDSNKAEERAAAFVEVIRAALRSDPDGLMVGEIRDKESLALTFEAAMTGHFVWTTIHANNAIGIVDRMLDLGLEPFKANDDSLVRGLISQRLLKKLCPDCKVDAREEGALPYLIKKDLQTLLGDNLGKYPIYTERKYTPEEDNKCPTCSGTGGVGRTVVAEVISPDAKLLELITSHKKREAITYWRENLDGITMLDHALRKVLTGVLDPIQVASRVGMFNPKEIDIDKVLVGLGSKTHLREVIS